MTISPLVATPSEFKDNIQGYHAKAMQFAAGLGISRSDLPPILHQKLDNWVATGDPDLSAEAVKKAKGSGGKKKRAAGDDAQERPAKKKAADGGEKKRKRKEQQSWDSFFFLQFEWHILAGNVTT